MYSSGLRKHLHGTLANGKQPTRATCHKKTAWQGNQTVANVQRLLLPAQTQQDAAVDAAVIFPAVAVAAAEAFAEHIQRIGGEFA